MTGEPRGVYRTQGENGKPNTALLESGTLGFDITEQEYRDNLDSRTKCNAAKRLVEDFERRLVAQPFARSIIQLILNHRKLFPGDGGERSSLRYELAHQAIEVLVRATLPA